MSVDLHGPIRTAVIEDDVIAPLLGQYMGEPACVTRRPAPKSATRPLCIIDPPRQIGNQDGLVARREVHVINLAFYGDKAEPGTPDDQTRAVEQAAHRAHELFHRNKWAVQGDGFRIIDIVASGPIAGPTDDDQTVARIVPLRLRLGRTG